MDLVRDLGVLLDTKLSFAEHIEAVINKSFKGLGFVLRVTKPFSDIACIKLLYFSYVRSILEYCATIWNPHYITYISNLERVQYKFIKHLNYRKHKYSQNYEESCSYHNLTSLQNRRTLMDMAFLHGLCNGGVDCPELTSRVLRFYTPRVRTRHTKLFALSHSSTNYAQHSIVNRMQKTYNQEFFSVDLFHNSKDIFRREALKVMDVDVKHYK